MVKIYLISSIVIFSFLAVMYVSYLINLHKYIKILSYGDMSDVVDYHSHDGYSYYKIKVLRVGVWGLYWEIEPTVYELHDMEFMYDYSNRLYEIIKKDYVK